MAIPSCGTFRFECRILPLSCVGGGVKEKQANKIGALRASFDGVDLGSFLAQRFAGAVRGRLRRTTVSLLRPALRPSSLLGDLKW